MIIPQIARVSPDLDEHTTSIAHAMQQGASQQDASASIAKSVEHAAATRYASFMSTKSATRTATARISFLTFAVAVGISFSVYVEVQQHHLHPHPFEKCIQWVYEMQGSAAPPFGGNWREWEARCQRPLVQGPLVVFNVKWPDHAGLGARPSIECNEEQTPGGDCYSLIEKYAPLISWGNQYFPARSAFLIVSTSSIIVREMGLEPGAFGLEMLRAMTLGTYDFMPLLGVEFNLDGAASRNAANPDGIAAMASAVLRNARLPTDSIAFLVGQSGCGGQLKWLRDADPSFLRRHEHDPSICQMAGCFHNYVGGPIDEPDFGRFPMRSLPVPRGDGQRTCNNPNVTLNDQFVGQVPLRAECGVSIGGIPGKLYGYERGCMTNFGSLKLETWYAKMCFSYLISSWVLGFIVSTVLLWMLTRQSSFLLMSATREIGEAFPKIRSAAVAAGVDVSEVSTRVASLFMLMEAALDGELQNNFVDVQAGLWGAWMHVVQMFFVAAPVQLNAYFHSVMTSWQTGVLLFHYSTTYAYLVAYYLQKLPFDKPRLLSACSRVQMLLLHLSVWIIVVNAIWMCSAIAYDAEYVIFVLGILVSIFGFCYSVSSAAGRLAKLEEIRSLAWAHGEAIVGQDARHAINATVAAAGVARDLTQSESCTDGDATRVRPVDEVEEAAQGNSSLASAGTTKERAVTSTNAVLNQGLRSMHSLSGSLSSSEHAKVLKRGLSDVQGVASSLNSMYEAGGLDKADRVARTMRSTRKEVMFIFKMGGLLLFATVGFAVLGSMLWDRGGGSAVGGYISTAAMPATVAIIKALGDKKISDTNKALKQEESPAGGGLTLPQHPRSKLS